MGNRTNLVARAPGLTITALAVIALLPGAAQAKTITQIIDSTGDGVGNGLDRARGVAVDGSGNVFVNGLTTHNVFKIDPNGGIAEIIDQSGDGTSNFLSPNSLGAAADLLGNLYLTASATDNAFWIDPNGVITEIIDPNGDGAGNTLNVPFGIAADGSGNVYVSGHSSDNVFWIDPNGVITEIIDATGDGAGNTLDGPFGVAVDGLGNVYVSGDDSHNILEIDPNGLITEIIDFTGDGAGNSLNEPAGVATDASGNVYVVGSRTDNAFRIDPNGVITEIIDATGDGTGNMLDAPLGIAVDGSGNVFVLGAVSDNAFRIDPNGVITEIIDATGDGAGKTLDSPFGVAVDGLGNLYVSGEISDNAFKIQFCGDGLLEAGEQCDDGNNINGDGCSANCLATPLPGCLSPGAAGKSQLQIKDQDPKGAGAKDKIQWKWLKGPGLSQVDFGDPTTVNGPDFKLRIYAGATPSMIVHMKVKAGAAHCGKPCWKPISTKGYKYGDKNKTSDGVKKLILKGDAPGKSKILIQGQDSTDLPLPSLPLDPNSPVIAQLSSSDPNLPCYEETFPKANVAKNGPKQFKAATP